MSKRWSSLPGISLLMRPRAVLAAAALLVVLSPALAAGAVLDTRVVSTSFFHETFEPDVHQEWDLVNRLDLKLLGLAHPGLSVHWSLAHRSEVMEVGVEKSLPTTYQGFLRFKPNRRLALTVGRHWTYGGVATTRLDGATLGLTEAGIGELRLFAGTRDFLLPGNDSPDGFGGEDFDNSGIWGAVFRSDRSESPVSCALSFARQFRAGEEEALGLGADLAYRLPEGAMFRAEHRYDLANSLTNQFRVRWDQRLERCDYFVSYQYRENSPRNYDYSYIARYFRDRTWFRDSLEKQSRQVRAHVSVPIERLYGFRVDVDAIEIFRKDDDQAHGVSFGFSRENLSFGYRLQRGFGGDEDGLYASLRHRVATNLWAWGDVNRVAYKFAGMEVEDDYRIEDSSLATRVGADLRLKGFDVRTAVEYLNNPRAESEVRVLLRLGYGVSFGEMD